MKFDDSEAAKDGGGCPKEGAYTVECVNADPRYGKEKGTPYIALKLVIQLPRGKTWTIYDNVMCAGKGAGIGRKKAEAFRVDVEDGEINEEQFVGKKAVAYLVHDSYQGKPKLSVDIGQGEFCGYDLADDHEGDVGF